MTQFTHLDESGAARMVDVGQKLRSRRVAVASGLVRMLPSTLSKICEQHLPKGNVLEVARLAGIIAAKKTSDLIPLCHNIPLESIELVLEPVGADAISIQATVASDGKTGVEMEALTAVSVAALTVYDMCKAIDRGITIDAVKLEEKSGGVHGDYRRSPDSVVSGAGD